MVAGAKGGCPDSRRCCPSARIDVLVREGGHTSSVGKDMAGTLAPSVNAEDVAAFGGSGCQCSVKACLAT